MNMKAERETKTGTEAGDEVVAMQRRGLMNGRTKEKGRLLEDKG